MNEAERRRYDRDLKRYRDNLAVLDYSVNEGREEGMRQGRAEGIAQGREEAVLEIAKNMKNAGMDINKIADLTGIESKAIEAL
jgi:predicted transposase/invertase (TIGR01784 family)